MTTVPDLSGLKEIAWQQWREEARCAGTADEFVDVSPTEAERLIRTHCYRCVVVGACREQGEAEKHKFPTVMGATYFGARQRYRESP